MLARCVEFALRDAVRLVVVVRAAALVIRLASKTLELVAEFFLFPARLVLGALELAAIVRVDRVDVDSFAIGDRSSSGHGSLFLLLDDDLCGGLFFLLLALLAAALLELGDLELVLLDLGLGLGELHAKIDERDLIDGALARLLGLLELGAQLVTLARDVVVLLTLLVELGLDVGDLLAQLFFRLVVHGSCCDRSALFLGRRLGGRLLLAARAQVGALFGELFALCFEVLLGGLECDARVIVRLSKEDADDESDQTDHKYGNSNSG